MGPRLDGRGDMMHDTEGEFLELASMGPRLDGRGDGVSGSLRVVGSRELQWGRGLMAAVTTSVRITDTLNSRRFNGAAA